MGEQTIRIASSESGSYVAMRDAFETAGGNARVIERVDFASGKFGTPIGNATRGNSSAINAAETFDMTNLPADLTGNLITVGDKAMLCVAAEATVAGGGCTITPIVYDGEGTPGIVTILTPKSTSQPHLFRRGSSSGNYVLPVLTWDVCGAYKIGLHISAIWGSSNAMKLWGWVL